MKCLNDMRGMSVYLQQVDSSFVCLSKGRAKQSTPFVPTFSPWRPGSAVLTHNNNAGFDDLEHLVSDLHGLINCLSLSALVNLPEKIITQKGTVIQDADIFRPQTNISQGVAPGPF